MDIVDTVTPMWEASRDSGVGSTESRWLDARLPCADPRTRFRVVYVARVAGEVDLGIQRDEVIAGADGHVAQKG
jgi:hypothetical protein